jgi:nucleoside-diphosphate-sugar epimerase
MKVLLIGGTGTISSAVTRCLVQSGAEVTLLNRATRPDRVCAGARVIEADVNQDETTLRDKLRDQSFDVAIDFVAFVPGQLERDVRLFSNHIRQFIFISSASAYQKPLNHYLVNESTPLANPAWEYSRNKIACEEYLMGEYRKNGFPVTIVRPSHTYDERTLPVAVHGKKGSWQVIDRILKGKPILVHGDGSSLWTLTWSEDLARALCALVGNPSAIGEAFHITSDESLSWNQVYDRIGDAFGVPVRKYHVTTDFLSFCDPEYSGTIGGDKGSTIVFDNSKIKRLVPSFRAEVPFHEGAIRCAAYLLANPCAQIADPEFDVFCDRVIKVQEDARAAFFADIAHR